MSNFLGILKKDIKLILNKKILILFISPIILYSAYINFIYSKQDINPNPIYLYNISSSENSKEKDIIKVYSQEEMYKGIEKENKSIGLIQKENDIHLIHYSSGSIKNDALKERIAISKLNSSFQSNVIKIGKFNRVEKLKREMTSEVFFFEIIAIIFMGATSVLFKERNMGVIKTHSVLPFSMVYFIASKLIIFYLINLAIFIFLIGTNIGFGQVYSIIKRTWILTGILSTCMILLSHISVSIFKDIKQFGLFYAFVIVIMTSPIFLVANTPLNFEWIKVYPLYTLYVQLKMDFLNRNLQV